MISIIVAFPKIEDAKKIRSILVKRDFDVCAICDKGSSVVATANKQDMGIVITGYKLLDMHYSELFSYLPESYRLVLVGSASRFNDVSTDIRCIATPIKIQELVKTIEELSILITEKYTVKKQKGKKRTEEEKKIIAKAKAVLMEKNGLTEEEAHRFLQKTSMNSGTDAVETAQKILILYD